MIHPCNCREYNGKQCYNCLNGAHSLCSTCGMTNSATLGLPIEVLNSVAAQKITPDRAKEDEHEKIAQILRDNITFSGQVGDYVIHGAINKIIEHFSDHSELATITQLYKINLQKSIDMKVELAKQEKLIEDPNYYIHQKLTDATERDKNLVNTINSLTDQLTKQEVAFRETVKIQFDEIKQRDELIKELLPLAKNWYEYLKGFEGWAKGGYPKPDWLEKLPEYESLIERASLSAKTEKK